MLKNILYHPFFIRLFHWEYWSFNTVYGPIYIYWVWLAIRSRSFFFFNAANPAIKNGGFLMESKKEIYDLMPGEYYPKTILVEKNFPAERLSIELRKAELHFPLIAKPDIGMRGLMVKKIENIDEVLQYASLSKVNFLIQEFIPYENEVGIFYYRYPGEARGNISGIVGKEFLTVTGDGISSIEELLKKDKRFVLQIPSLKKQDNGLLKVILPVNEKQLLVPYGNHARGAKFLDLTSLADEDLINAIDHICKQVKGFYFGRLDIRFNSWEELKQGKNFSIIELNGAGSEPTHMYDPKHSIFFAWKEIIRHWNILYRISRLNKKKNISYLTVKQGLQMFRDNKKYVATLTGE
ncbi:MAG: D-alanine--D-alanine ligase [Bacteroidetes bacterium]|nr:D-alanine--D-alanine ligase [Bacteroidota bacterium]